MWLRKREDFVENKGVCPIVAKKTSAGRDIDVWDLTERDIFEVLDGIMYKMGSTESYYLDMQAVELWGQKHPKCSAEFIKGVFDLLQLYPQGRENELLLELTSFLESQLSEARTIAEYVKASRGDLSPASDEEILKVIEKQEKIEKKRRKNTFISEEASI